MEDTNEQRTSDFRSFLEKVPPGVLLVISDLKGKSHFNSNGWYMAIPDIVLHCDSEKCDGERLFAAMDAPLLFLSKGAEHFVNYRCKNCTSSTKSYALFLKLDASGAGGQAYKYGEAPVFGPPTPSRVVSLIGPQRDFFLKGRRAENMGLGIAAFAYYRRVVEDQKNRLFDEIIKVCHKLHVGEPLVLELTAAKKEIQFSKAIGSIKEGLPQALLISGHNPLTLLHSALSEGLHAQTDEQCLELATSIRLVLIDFVERVQQVLREEAELSSAINRLMRKSTTEAVSKALPSPKLD